MGSKFDSYTDTTFVDVYRSHFNFLQEVFYEKKLFVRFGF